MELRVQRNPHKSLSSGRDVSLGLWAQRMFEIGMGASGRYIYRQWRTEILKALQNRAKLNPIVKTVKSC